MGVYIFMAVFMCVCVRLRVLAGRGNRGLGNLRHTDTALIIDSVSFLCRHYKGFEPGPAFMKYILGRFWRGGKCWSVWDGGWGGARSSGRRRALNTLSAGPGRKPTQSCICFYPQIQVLFPGKKRGLVFILPIVLTLLSKLGDYGWITDGVKVWDKWEVSVHVSLTLILATGM